MKNNKKGDIISRIPAWIWTVLSLLVAILVWSLLSKGEVTGRAFPPLLEVLGSYNKMAVARGVFWSDIASSLISAGVGFALGFVFGVPVAFLMAWYRPVRNIIEPWIQFIRNIPPLAYVPLVVIAAGVGRTPQIIVICIATFLTISITVFQGVINVDETLIKAARVLGANDSVLFTKVIFPATTPFIITSVRLGISVALTTLIAAESTGASAGLGMRIRALSSTFETQPMMLYIIVVGVIGMLAEKILKFFERRLTGWQEKREI
jgi:NitT/TauT family transport system permease protein